jgi:isopenicillin N synthase-like dioxygenase
MLTYSQPCLSSLIDHPSSTCSHEIGFFLLQHDIPECICNKALFETQQFFQRPIDHKMTISYEHSAAFRGYMPLGVENTEGVIDGREQIEYAAEYHDTSSAHQAIDAPFYHRLRSSNPWPDAVQPSLKPAIIDYVRSVMDVANQLRESMCAALDVDPREVDYLFGPVDGVDPSFWSIKLVSYPPVLGSGGEPQQGVGAHTDSNFMTLICQDSSSSGLQVQNVQGGWINVPPTSPTVLICNIGELAEVWSNGYFLATPHRVLRQSSDIQTSRISLPIFYNPKIDTVMKPINTDCMAWTRGAQKQWRRENNKLMGSVGENSFKSLARSHPKVFDKHHGDLRLLDDGAVVKR